jgi:hypothetical protein
VHSELTEKKINRPTKPTNITMKILPLALAVLAGVNYSSQAALTVTGGDFGTTPVSGDVLDVPGWFESSTAGYNYNEYTTAHPEHFSVNKGRKLALDGGGAAGYLYQSLGAYGGESSLTITCDSLFRDGILPARVPATSLGQVTFSVWDLPGSTVGVDGTSLSALTGAVQLDSFLFDASAQTYAGDTFTFLHTYNISGATLGNNIWLDITKVPAPGLSEVILDNVNVVPEPTSVALFGDIPGISWLGWSEGERAFRVKTLGEA